MEGKFFFTAKQIGFSDILDVEDRIKARNPILGLKLNELSNLDCEQRFKYFMKTIVKSQEIWSVFSPEGIFLFEWDGNKDYSWNPYSTPVFPHLEVAKEFFKDYEGLEFAPVPLDDFIDEILTPLSREKMSLCIFPVFSKNETILISPGNFIIELQGYWEEFYKVEMEIHSDIKDKFLEYCCKIILRRQMVGRPIGKLP